MYVIHEFERDGKRYRFVPDEEYVTRGSYCLDTEEETRAAEEEEIDKIERGEWTVVGMLVDRPCPGPHCAGCGGREELDSLWGIVIDNTKKALEQFARESGL